MKLSTVITQAILLASISASPVAFPDGASIQGKDRLCSDSTKNKACYMHDFNKCVPYMEEILTLECHSEDITTACTNAKVQQANQYCHFFCAKIKNKSDCEAAKKSSGWNANCDKEKYCD